MRSASNAKCPHGSDGEGCSSNLDLKRIG